MLDEKLNALIRKYGIYDAIGGWADSGEIKGPLSRLRKNIRRIEGEFRLVRALNTALDAVPENDSVALWGEGKTREKIRFWMLSPKNRKKIRFLICDRKDDIRRSYLRLPIIASREIEQIKPSIKAIILMHWESGRCANLLGRQFSGEIIDIVSLICENDLIGFFSDRLKHNPYADIFVARQRWEKSEDGVQKKLWHKRVIAQYIRARDFLSAGEKIKQYEAAGYEDAGSYRAFWGDMEELFSDIKDKLAKREQRDVFIHWLDRMEKDDFFTMPWVGDRNNGRIFHNVYTTMTHTTNVLKSIFTGKSVKFGKLMDLKKIPYEQTVFSDYPSKMREVHFFSGLADKTLGREIMHSLVFPSHTPVMMLIWYALDKVLNTSNTCVIFLHAMESHNPFLSGEHSHWEYTLKADTIFSFNQSMDYTKVAKISREYLDKELRWYNDLLPPNAIRIFMSDHGGESDLTNQNVNMPFKIMGDNVIPGNERRLFSYKDLYKFIDCCINSKRNMDDVFRDYAVIDVIDPYNRAYGYRIRMEAWNHFFFEQKQVDKTYLKRYLQTTKVVTAEGEYYTINILGEETYYRDKECKNNLIGEPIYAERIAELREKAGKFYNPWKEKRQVAIDFYEYLGIEEKDILAQCY